MRVSPLNHTKRNYTKPKFTCRCSFHGNAASFKGMELLLGREQIVPHLVEAGPCAPKHPVLLLLLLEPFPIQTRPLARIGGHACKLSHAESLFRSENDSVRSQKGLKDVTLNMADPDRCFPSRSSGASGLDVFGSVSRSWRHCICAARGWHGFRTENESDIPVRGQSVCARLHTKGVVHATNKTHATFKLFKWTSTQWQRIHSAIHKFFNKHDIFPGYCCWNEFSSKIVLLIMLISH